jgi:hypothetical protein
MHDLARLKITQYANEYPDHKDINTNAWLKPLSTPKNQATKGF